MNTLRCGTTIKPHYEYNYVCLFIFEAQQHCTHHTLTAGSALLYSICKHIHDAHNPGYLKLHNMGQNREKWGESYGD